MPESIILASRASCPGAAQANAHSLFSSVSGDGRYVAFLSEADNLHPDDPDGGVSGRDVYVRDIQTHETMLVSRASGMTGAKGNGRSQFPSVSMDGRFVVFQSWSSNLHPDDPDGCEGGQSCPFVDVFLRDLSTDETILVSRASGAEGVKSNGADDVPQISSDGRYVVFTSQATNLHPDDTDIVQDVFVRDLETQETRLVSRASGPEGVKANEFSSSPQISGDGRYVTFHSAASNLHPDDPDGGDLGLDIFVRDLWTDETILASRASGADGIKGNGVSTLPLISSNGRYVAFQSEATNLHADDMDVISDIFVRDLQTEQVILVSRARGVTGVKGDSFSRLSGTRSISADGRYVAFRSGAANLHPDDTDETQDVFVRDLQTHSTILVSRASGTNGDKGNNGSSAPSMSANGRDVAFHSNATNLHPDATDTSFDVFVRDILGPPDLTVTPNPVEFGAVPIGESSAPRSLTLSNSGMADVTVNEVSDADTPFALAGGTCGSPPFMVPSQGSCTLDYIFGPTVTGLFEAIVTFTSNATGSPYTVLRGNGIALMPILAFDPESLDFGDVEVGTTSAPQFAVLQNVGAADATGLAFTDPGAGFTADTSACGDSLPAGGSCDVAVTFTPSEAGAATASLEVASAEEASASLSLSGTGVGEPAFAPTAMAVDPSTLVTDGNGVLEPNELVEVMPTWRNDGNVGASLTGTASDFTGPDGGVYSLAASDADYGLVEPAATATCQDTGVCYRMSVNDPVVRPATHWEATFDEELSDDTTKTWTLHIGDSFVDVPTANLFYTSIETLLHHGVTGGCSGTEYCSAGSNTRGQMAVFLLKAVEGGDYAPPACAEGEEVFLDVPFDHPFCQWIEELAARKITSGCGGGDYCPGNSVTRGQMAVFLLKALEGGGYAPPECTGVFTDVTCPSQFADWIEELAERDITSGCAAEPPAFCPAAPVTRGQMAVFLSKAFGLTLYGP